MAMISLDAMRSDTSLHSLRFEILASDISTSALRLAKLGRYESIAISRGLPQEYRDRYFTQDGRVWSISPEVRQLVTLKKTNLSESFAALGRFDIIMCRNVAIYFSEELKRDLFRRLAASLYPEGVLFLGASESLTNYSAEFDMKTGATGVYYRLRGGGEPSIA